MSEFRDKALRAIDELEKQRDNLLSLIDSPQKVKQLEAERDLLLAGIKEIANMKKSQASERADVLLGELGGLRQTFR